LKTLITLALVAISLGLVACSDDGGEDLLPPSELTAGFVVTVVPPVDTADDDQLDCRIKFTGTARGGTPPYFYRWDFGALLVRAVQRVGGDTSQINEFIGTQAAIGNGTYAIKLDVGESAKGASGAVSTTGFVFFRCEPGDPPSTFTF
jgi:hypothetical protein